MKIRKQKNNRGSVLAYGLIIMTVVMIILVSIIGYIVSQLRFSANRIEREKAFQMAEAGIYYYRWYLAHATDGMNSQQLDAFWYGGTALGVDNDYVANYNDPEGGAVIGQYSIHVDKPDHNSTVAWVTSTGTVASGESRVVKVRFRRPSWSEYVFLSNSFMNFGDQAEVWGKVHSNGGIRFDGKAHDTVSSLLPSFYDPTYGGSKKQFGVHTTVNLADPTAPNYPWPDGTVPNRPDVFMGGRQFPVPEVSFNGVTADLANMKTQAQAGRGKYFDNTGQGRKILLKTDGTYDVCTVNAQNNDNTHTIKNYTGVVAGATNGTNGNSCLTSTCCTGTSCSYISNKSSKGRCISLTNYNIVDGGVIFVENNAWVDGSVNGKKITIVAANLTGGANGPADIYIGSESRNITYAALDCNNNIGLIGQKDVRVLSSCPIDYVVDAALLAQSGVVGINDNGSFSAKGSLTFNGAIASYLQPYFQSGNSGFATRFYFFNNNLLYCPPPYFPTGTEYSIDLWEEL